MKPQKQFAIIIAIKSYSLSRFIKCEQIIITRFINTIIRFSLSFAIKNIEYAIWLVLDAYYKNPKVIEILV